MSIARSAARQSSAESARLRASCTNEQHARTSFDQARVFLTQPAWEWVRARTLNIREKVAETPSRDFDSQTLSRRVQRGVGSVRRSFNRQSVAVRVAVIVAAGKTVRIAFKIKCTCLRANYPRRRGDRNREEDLEQCARSTAMTSTSRIWKLQSAAGRGTWLRESGDIRDNRYSRDRGGANLEARNSVVASLDAHLTRTSSCGRV